jgi:hypothetical protein
VKPLRSSAGWRPFVLVGICFAVALAGCGGDGDDPEIKTGPDQRARISQLEKRKQQLQKQLEAQRKTRAAEAKAKTVEVGGDDSVNAILADQPGAAGLVIGAPGAGAPDLSGGSLAGGDAWSTIKVPIAERVLDDFGGPSRISPVQQTNIANAITLSDNEAASALFADLEQKHGGLEPASAAVGEMLRQAGDAETVISTAGRESFSTYGQTDWSLAEQFKYMAALAGGCIGSAADRSYLLGQMAAVGGSDNFGLGAAGFPAKWKGGWGPGTDGKYLVRQMGVVEVNGKQIVVAMAAIPDDGTFESGKAMLSNIARAATSRLPDQISGPTGC